MSLFRSAAHEPDRPTVLNHAEITAMATLAHQARLDELAAIVDYALTGQAARPADLRNRELIDLCLDLRNAGAVPLLRPAVPVVPGRP